MHRLFIFLFIFGPLSAGAQTTDSALTDKFLLNFSVPDMPAGKALGTDASNLLRPSDIQKFAASLAPFYSGNQAAIPKNFALEFAPWKMASRHWTIKDYNKGGKSLLYNSAFSIATTRDTGTGASKLSVGYHLSIGSKNSDILKAIKRTYLNALLYGKQDAMFSVVDNLERHWVYNVARQPRGATNHIAYTKEHVGEFAKYIESLWGTTIADSTLKNYFSSFVKVFNLGSQKDLHQFLNDQSAFLQDPARPVNLSIDKLIQNWKDSMWNASRTDIAIAWTASSKDSLIKNAQFSALNLWFTQSCRLSNWGQLLLGGSLALPRTEKNDTVSTNASYTVNCRLYAGGQHVRGFGELQYQYQNFTAFKKSLLLNFGTEFRVGQQFWAVASAGIDNYLAVQNPFSKLVSSLSLRYGFNQSK